MNMDKLRWSQIGARDVNRYLRLKQCSISSSTSIGSLDYKLSAPIVQGTTAPVRLSYISALKGTKARLIDSRQRQLFAKSGLNFSTSNSISISS